MGIGNDYLVLKNEIFEVPNPNLSVGSHFLSKRSFFTQFMGDSYSYS